MVEATAPTHTVDEILSWYHGQNAGVLTNLARLLNHGRLGGTGKLVILPVDQGFEHGPLRAFGPNMPTHDPHYHFELAIAAGCNAYAAPLGFLEAGAADFAGQIPLILKLNNHDILQDEIDPIGGQTASVKDALRLGCVGIGYTIYPGTAPRRKQYEQFRAIAEEAKEHGLAVILWAYARGADLKKDDETAIDTIAYSAQIAAQLGAHVIKVKLPSAHVWNDKNRAVIEAQGLNIDNLTDRVSYVKQAAFNGRRIIIHSGGGKKSDEAVFDEIRAIRDGGAFGSIMGRNFFQREWDESLDFMDTIMSIYEGKEA